MDVKKDWTGKLLRAFGFSVIIGYLAKLGIMQIFCMIVIIYIFEEFLQELEKPSATKRFFAKIGTIVLLIVSYLAIRVAIGIAFNMPIISAIDTWAGNEGWNKIFPSHTTPVDLGIELFLVLPVSGLALLLVKGKTVGRSVVLVLSTLGFLFLAYQAKQPDHFQSMNRKIDAGIAADTTANHVKASNLEMQANAVYASFPSGIGEIYDIKTIAQSQMVEQIHLVNKIPVHQMITPGWSARVVDPKLKTIMINGVQYLEVFLPNEKGLPANARKIYVNREMVEITQGPPRPQRSAVPSPKIVDGKYREYFSLRDGEMSGWINPTRDMVWEYEGDYRMEMGSGATYDSKNYPRQINEPFRFIAVGNLELTLSKPAKIG